MSHKKKRKSEHSKHSHSKHSRSSLNSSKKSISSIESSPSSVTDNSDNVASPSPATDTATDAANTPNVGKVAETQVAIPTAENQPSNSNDQSSQSKYKAAKICAVLDMINETLRVLGLLMTISSDDPITLGLDYSLLLFLSTMHGEEFMLGYAVLGLTEGGKLAASISLLIGVLKLKKGCVKFWLYVFGIDVLLFTVAFAFSLNRKQSRKREIMDIMLTDKNYENYTDFDREHELEWRSRDKYLESDPIKLYVYVIIQLLRMWAAWIFISFIKVVPILLKALARTIPATGFAQPGGMMPMGNSGYPNRAPNFNQRDAPPPKLSGQSCHPCGACDLPIDKAAQIISYIDLGIEVILTLWILSSFIGLKTSSSLFSNAFGDMFLIYVLYEFLKLTGSVCLVFGVRKFQVKESLVYVWLAIMGFYGLLFLFFVIQRLATILGVFIFLFRCYAYWVVIAFLMWRKQGQAPAGGIPMGYVQYPTQPVSQYPNQNQVYPYPLPYPSYPAPYPGP